MPQLPALLPPPTEIIEDTEIDAAKKQESDVVLVAAEGAPGIGPTGESSSGRNRNPRRRNNAPKQSTEGSPSTGPQNSGRRRKFNASLTDPSAESSTTPELSAAEKFRSNQPKGDDLTSTLIRSFNTTPYPDCPICFNSIHPAQPTWSCSPSLLTDTHCCWTTFHLKCIRSWASKSVKDFEDAWRARGEEKKGEWRCPGCQAKRQVVPNGYWCFCGAQPEPKPPRLATPHSCSNACTRPRTCGHACPIACHPGPCPPCQVTTQLPCHCGAQTLAFKCTRLQDAATNEEYLSCGGKCNKKLSCGNHTCEKVCHAGECDPCTIRETVRCYCGKVDKDVPCGQGEAIQCLVDTEKWIGKFACDNLCERPFDCGVHRCQEPCHPPSATAPPCPRSPSLVTHCPCGKHRLEPSSAPFFSPASAQYLTRTSCATPIPTCTSMCLKPLSTCEHACSTPCHEGDCPPCMVMVVRPCRCGSARRDVRCSELNDQKGVEVLCDKPCTALRACGRHQCNRVCCPLASLGNKVKGKGKKRMAIQEDLELGAGQGGLHECDLVCGKMLGCNNHRCEERDHKGPCPPCLRSSFEEMICHCGQTIIEPPIPCGTKMYCPYPCRRSPPACGHPLTQHACHDDSVPCPPCPFLTKKVCACGKKELGNIRCSQEKVSCGLPCGKTLACGFHRCERLCHGDECGSCSAVCGKPRKLCLPEIHQCPDRCHAPSACSEVAPCQSIVTITCPCGRMRQSVHCGRCTSNPAGRSSSQQLKCTNECAIAKRNARLAEALGISVDKDGTKEKEIVWRDDVIVFGRANPKFVTLVESTFAQFIKSERKSQILPHMPPERRKFVHDVAAVYRIDTEMVDQEPNRSVRLLRRVDTRIPQPLLSASISSSGSSIGPTSNNGLGKLALRVPAAGGAPQPAMKKLSAGITNSGATRGWSSTVQRSGTNTPATSERSWTPASVSGTQSPSAGAHTRGADIRPPDATSRVGTPTPGVTVDTAPATENWEDDV